ncbi:MAG: 3(2),5-bisphosphate nucleotidase CysQ [Francisellaceae bacterium]|nr:3(2),5-bisphosphate nucleotidase CysQ [Francisellaceae bacterium]
MGFILYNELLANVLELALEVSLEVKKIYLSDNFKIYVKSDNSPVTSADLKAHHIIAENLQKLTPWPLISEEAFIPSFKERALWPEYWLIDPLDGTREFIKKTGEFTINIALIRQGIPIMGVVGVPMRNEFYWSIQGQGAFLQKNEVISPISVNCFSNNPFQVTVSRHHSSQSEMLQFLEPYEPYEIIPCGSTLKMCLVASGSAHIYPRLGPTYEWDTAAGQCIVEAAGGRVKDFKGNDLRYNTKDSLINPPFIAQGKEKVN